MPRPVRFCRPDHEPATRLTPVIDRSTIAWLRHTASIENVRSYHGVGVNRVQQMRCTIGDLRMCRVGRRFAPGLAYREPPSCNKRSWIFWVLQTFSARPRLENVVLLEMVKPKLDRSVTLDLGISANIHPLEGQSVLAISAPVPMAGRASASCNGS